MSQHGCLPTPFFHYNPGEVSASEHTTFFTRWNLATPAEHSHYEPHQLQISNEGTREPTSSKGIAREPFLSKSPRDTRKKSQSFSLRLRVSRACDRCHQLRCKCDGRNPCGHCIELGQPCKYVREQKKRGKSSRRRFIKASNQSTEGTNRYSGDDGPKDVTEDDATKDENSQSPHSQARNNMSSGGAYGTIHTYGPFAFCQPPTIESSIGPAFEIVAPEHSYGLDCTYGVYAIGHHPLQGDYSPPPSKTSSPTPTQLQPVSCDGNVGNHDHYTRHYQHLDQMAKHCLHLLPGKENANPCAEVTLQVQPEGRFLFQFVPSETNLGPFSISPNVSSSCRYPVLLPILPIIKRIISIRLVCDLLDQYFASSSLSHDIPQSPFIASFVFGKEAILHEINPRTCSPPLLTSMLWVASQTSDPIIWNSPSDRERVCQKLLELTYGLLRAPTGGSGFGDVSYNYDTGGGIEDPRGEPSAKNGTIDDVVTYMHLATVLSATKYRTLSIRWWNAAWSNIRQVEFNLEPLLSQAGMQPDHRDAHLKNHYNILEHTPLDKHPTAPITCTTEEQQGEWQRIYLFLCTMDSQMALCKYQIVL